VLSNYIDWFVLIALGWLIEKSVGRNLEGSASGLIWGTILAGASAEKHD
jgi:predicted metal-binding membrane protein